MRIVAINCNSWQYNFRKNIQHHNATSFKQKIVNPKFIALTGLLTYFRPHIGVGIFLTALILDKINNDNDNNQNRNNKLQRRR